MVHRTTSGIQEKIQQLVMKSMTAHREDFNGVAARMGSNVQAALEQLQGNF